MSRDERYGTRDLVFSRWHRYTFGDDASMIDLDSIGYCDRCKSPLYVIEATRDVGQHKATTIAERVARSLNVPGWLVMYKPGPPCSCISTAIIPGCLHGIEAVRVRRFAPSQTGLTVVSVHGFASVLDKTREFHAAIICAPLDEIGRLVQIKDGAA